MERGREAEPAPRIDRPTRRIRFMAPPSGRPKVLDPAGEQARYEHAQRRARIIGRVIVGFFAVLVIIGGSIGVAYDKIFSKVDFGKPLNQVLPASARPAEATPKATSAAGGGGGGTAKNI